MLLVEKNIEMLCDKNHISQKELFERLEIREEVIFSKSTSKTAKRAKEEVYKTIADFFGVDVEELKNRFWDQPAIMWQLSSDKEKFFSNLVDSTKNNETRWSLLDEKKALATICAESKYFNPNKMFSYIAYEYRTDEYVAILYCFTEHRLEINMESRQVVGSSLFTEPVKLRLEIPGQKDQIFYGNYICGEYVKSIFKIVSDIEDKADSGKWYKNSEYESGLNWCYCAEFKIGLDLDEKGIHTKVEDVTQRVAKEKNTDDSIVDLIMNLQATGHVSDEELEKLQEQLSRYEDDDFEED